MLLYHVCPAWDGGDLESLRMRLWPLSEEEVCRRYHRRWQGTVSDSYTPHVEYIHFHTSLEEAVKFALAYGGEILEVEVNDGDIVWDDLEYPHPMVADIVPAECVRRPNGTAAGNLAYQVEKCAETL